MCVLLNIILLFAYLVANTSPQDLPLENLSLNGILHQQEVAKNCDRKGLSNDEVNPDVLRSHVVTSGKTDNGEQNAQETASRNGSSTLNEYLQSMNVGPRKGKRVRFVYKKRSRKHHARNDKVREDDISNGKGKQINSTGNSKEINNNSSMFSEHQNSVMTKLDANEPAESKKEYDYVNTNEYSLNNKSSIEESDNVDQLFKVLTKHQSSKSDKRMGDIDNNSLPKDSDDVDQLFEVLTKQQSSNDISDSRSSLGRDPDNNKPSIEESDNVDQVFEILAKQQSSNDISNSPKNMGTDPDNKKSLTEESDNVDQVFEVLSKQQSSNDINSSRSSMRRDPDNNKSLTKESDDVDQLFKVLQKQRSSNAVSNSKISMDSDLDTNKSLTKESDDVEVFEVLTKNSNDKMNSQKSVGSRTDNNNSLTKESDDVDQLFKVLTKHQSSNDISNSRASLSRDHDNINKSLPEESDNVGQVFELLTKNQNGNNISNSPKNMGIDPDDNEPLTEELDNVDQVFEVLTEDQNNNDISNSKISMGSDLGTNKQLTKNFFEVLTKHQSSNDLGKSRRNMGSDLDNNKSLTEESDNVDQVFEVLPKHQSNNDISNSQRSVVSDPDTNKPLTKESDDVDQIFEVLKKHQINNDLGKSRRNMGSDPDNNKSLTEESDNVDQVFEVMPKHQSNNDISNSQRSMGSDTVNNKPFTELKKHLSSEDISKSRRNMSKDPGNHKSLKEESDNVDQLFKVLPMHQSSNDIDNSRRRLGSDTVNNKALTEESDNDDTIYEGSKIHQGINDMRNSRRSMGRDPDNYKSLTEESDNDDQLYKVLPIHQSSNDISTSRRRMGNGPGNNIDSGKFTSEPHEGPNNLIASNSKKHSQLTGSYKSIGLLQVLKTSKAKTIRDILEELQMTNELVSWKLLNAIERIIRHNLYQANRAKASEWRDLLHILEEIKAVNISTTEFLQMLTNSEPDIKRIKAVLKAIKKNKTKLPINLLYTIERIIKMHYYRATNPLEKDEWWRLLYILEELKGTHGLTEHNPNDNNAYRNLGKSFKTNNEENSDIETRDYILELHQLLNNPSVDLKRVREVFNKVLDNNISVPSDIVTLIKNRMLYANTWERPHWWRMLKDLKERNSVHEKHADEDEWNINADIYDVQNFAFPLFHADNENQRNLTLKLLRLLKTAKLDKKKIYEILILLKNRVKLNPELQSILMRAFNKRLKGVNSKDAMWRKILLTLKSLNNNDEINDNNGHIRKSYEKPREFTDLVDTILKNSDSINREAVSKDLLFYLQQLSFQLKTQELNSMKIKETVRKLQKFNLK